MNLQQYTWGAAQRDKFLLQPCTESLTKTPHIVDHLSQMEKGGKMHFQNAMLFFLKYSNEAKSILSSIMEHFECRDHYACSDKTFYMYLIDRNELWCISANGWRCRKNETLKKSISNKRQLVDVLWKLV